MDAMLVPAFSVTRWDGPGPPDAPVSVHDVDFDRLDAFREDRAGRGFS
ncbi:hypothetical protein [Nonomuraea basaltis]|nr:hypothetical protein [Nonomuraea basaltis]